MPRGQFCYTGNSTMQRKKRRPARLADASAFFFCRSCRFAARRARELPSRVARHGVAESVQQGPLPLHDLFRRDV
jgi:hypothetical protein